MIVETRNEKDVDVLKISGVLNAGNVDDIKMYFDSILHRKTRLTVFDLENLEEIDSSGIGAIVSLVKRMRKKNRDVRIYKLSVTVKKIFDMLRLDKNIGIYEDWQKVIA